MYNIQHCFICHPSDSTVSEDAGIEPRTVATTALAVRRSNHSDRSHPLLGQISSTLGQISSTLGQISSTLGQIIQEIHYPTRPMPLKYESFADEIFNFKKSSRYGTTSCTGHLNSQAMPCPFVQARCLYNIMFATVCYFNTVELFMFHLDRLQRGVVPPADC